MARRRVDEVTVESGSVPKGRAYHTFTALGTHCVAVGGLAHSGVSLHFAPLGS